MAKMPAAADAKNAMSRICQVHFPACVSHVSVAEQRKTITTNVYSNVTCGQLNSFITSATGW